MRFAGWIVAAPLVFLAPAPRTFSTGPPDRAEIRPVVEDLTPGDRLIRILNDPKQDTEKRFSAARELGHMRFVPAIPHLLKNIAMPEPFTDTGTIIFLNSEHSDWADGPCIMALSRYGREVIAPAAKMYIAPTTSQLERRCIVRVFDLENSQRSLGDVRRYVDSLQNQVKNPAQVQLLAELARRLEERR
jgi:hypothetical protein